MFYSKNGSRGDVEIRMPNSKPTVPETYLCTSLKLDTTETIYVTGFEPSADKRTAHHMILFGCKSPGKPNPIFHCGAMDASQDQGQILSNYFFRNGKILMHYFRQ